MALIRHRRSLTSLAGITAGVMVSLQAGTVRHGVDGIITLKSEKRVYH